MIYYIYLVIAIAGELVGTTFLKYTEGFTRLWPSLITAAAYGVCFFFFAKALDHINLGPAYAIWSGMGIVVSTLLSIFLFKQSITPAGIGAIILILIGVVILNIYGTPH